MTYYFVSNMTNKILDILFRPGREATVAEIEAIARSLANQSGYPVRVLKGEDTGLIFAPCLGYGREERR